MEYDVCVREVSYYNVFVEANSKKEAAALAKAMVDHREVTAPYSITIEAEEGDAEKVFSPKTTEAETKTEAASCEAQERLMAQAKERRLEPKPCRTFGPMDGLRTELSGQASVIPTLEERDKALEVLWDEFGDIPMDPETEEMEDIFLSFLQERPEWIFGGGSMNDTVRAWAHSCTAMVQTERQNWPLWYIVNSSAQNAMRNFACLTPKAFACCLS